MAIRQPKDFKVARRRGEPIPFTLEGDDTIYQFTPPKQASMLFGVMDAEEAGEGGDMIQVKVTFDWLGEGLSEEHNDKLISRLRDPKDDLDMDALGDVITWLMEEGTGRPTT